MFQKRMSAKNKPAGPSMRVPHLGSRHLPREKSPSKVLDPSFINPENLLGIPFKITRKRCAPPKKSNIYIYMYINRVGSSNLRVPFVPNSGTRRASLSKSPTSPRLREPEERAITTEGPVRKSWIQTKSSVQRRGQSKSRLDLFRLRILPRNAALRVGWVHTGVAHKFRV